MIDYDNTATYQKDDYCMYNNSLYVANQDINTAEEFDSSHWDETSVINELEALNKSNNYSTTEQRIGTWMGKPLYRKVIQHTLTANPYTEVGRNYNWANPNISNLDKVVYVKGRYKGSLAVFYNGYSFEAAFTTSGGHSGEVQMGFNSSIYVTGNTVQLMIDYTKTTD